MSAPIDTDIILDRDVYPIQFEGDCEAFWHPNLDKNTYDLIFHSGENQIIVSFSAMSMHAVSGVQILRACRKQFLVLRDCLELRHKSHSWFVRRHGERLRDEVARFRAWGGHEAECLLGLNNE